MKCSENCGRDVAIKKRSLCNPCYQRYYKLGAFGNYGFRRDPVILTCKCGTSFSAIRANHIYCSKTCRKSFENRTEYNRLYKRKQRESFEFRWREGARNRERYHLRKKKAKR